MIWRTGEWSTTWAQSLIKTLSKKQLTALSELQDYHPHQSFENFMLKVILNRLKHQVRMIIAEERAGIRAG